MSNAAQSPVRLVPNQGWDRRLLICRYALAYEGFTLPMHAFVAVTERYVVIVDTLVNAATAEGLLAIARPYLAGRQLLVANTHADYDHAWGNQFFDGPGSPWPVLTLTANPSRAKRARHVFSGRVPIGYLAAIVAASNAGGSGSVVGDTTQAFQSATVNAAPVVDAQQFLRGTKVDLTFAPTPAPVVTVVPGG